MNNYFILYTITMNFSDTYAPFANHNDLLLKEQDVKSSNKIEIDIFFFNINFISLDNLLFYF